MKRIILLYLSLFLSMTAFGQKKGLEVAKLDSLPDLLKYYLEQSTSKHFEDPKIPRFLLKDRTDNFVFGVGGAIDTRLYLDAMGNRTNSFSLAKEDESSKYDNSVFDFTPFATNLTFKVLGKTKAGVIDGMINIDFGNSGMGVRLSQAYVDVFGIRIGKTNTAFRDEVSADQVDGNGNLSSTARKLPQISYSHRFKNGIRVQGGLEFSQSTSIWLKTQEKNYMIDQMNILSPDLTANIYYNGKAVHLYGGVNGRIMAFTDVKEQVRKDPMFAAQAGICWPFVKTPDQNHRLYLQAMYSHGMADCFSSMRQQGLSAIYDPQTNDCVVPNVAGGSLAYQVKFGDNSINLICSANTAMGHEKLDIGEMYHWAFAGSVNYFRTILTYGKVGVQVIAGRRTNLNLTKHSNLRTYLYFRYNF